MRKISHEIRARSVNLRFRAAGLSVPAFADPAANCYRRLVIEWRMARRWILLHRKSDTLRWRMFTGESGQLHKQADGTWTSTFGWSDRPDGRVVSFSLL